MKRLILTVFGLGALVGLALYASRSGPAPATAPLAESSAESTPAPFTDDRQPVRPVVARAPHPVPSAQDAGASNRGSTAMISPGDPRSTDALAFKYSTDILLASQSTYEQKQAAWKQLRDAGKLDPLIGDLERRAVEDPRSAVCAATLGQAYLQKCGAIQDIREQGILAMQADKVFDTALNLDSWNWEARFTKAVAMSYWPANMNKGQEVVQHFQTLVQQQEAQAPQPQFAETYLWLGDQYQKAGQTDEARTTWERGATLFPNHDKLRSRLAPAQ